MLQVMLNGKAHHIQEKSTVSDLIKELKLAGKLAVEINCAIVPRSRFTIHTIAQGDTIEIVHAIGGG